MQEQEITFDRAIAYQVGRETSMHGATPEHNYLWIPCHQCVKQNISSLGSQRTENVIMTHRLVWGVSTVMLRTQVPGLPLTTYKMPNGDIKLWKLCQSKDKNAPYMRQEQHQECRCWRRSWGTAGASWQRPWIRPLLDNREWLLKQICVTEQTIPSHWFGHRADDRGIVSDEISWSESESCTWQHQPTRAHKKPG